MNPLLSIKGTIISGFILSAALILLIGGKPVPYALSRIPKNSDSKGNLAQGATGKGVELNARDKWICEQVGPKLNDIGLIFVGIDIIGEYLTEINITSPTCAREIFDQTGENPITELFKEL